MRNRDSPSSSCHLGSVCSQHWTPREQPLLGTQTLGHLTPPWGLVWKPGFDCHVLCGMCPPSSWLLFKKGKLRSTEVGSSITSQLTWHLFLHGQCCHLGSVLRDIGEVNSAMWELLPKTVPGSVFRCPLPHTDTHFESSAPLDTSNILSPISVISD